MANLETQTVDRVGDLAATLVDELGVDDAVTVCMNNHWYGVLDRIRRNYEAN